MIIFKSEYFGLNPRCFLIKELSATSIAVSPSCLFSFLTLIFLLEIFSPIFSNLLLLEKNLSVSFHPNQ